MEIHQGSSSGCREGSYKLEVKTHALQQVKGDELAESSIPAMVSIMAPSALTEQEQRVPVDLAIVLHVHVLFKAPEKWQDLLMEAVRVIMDKLDDKDRLAVFPSGGGSRTSNDSLNEEEKNRTVEYTETLLPMSSKNKPGFSAAMKVAIQKCDNSLVRALESADSILYGQGYDYEKERRASYIIVISNSQDDMGSFLTWRFRSVLAFGFRDSRNARTMHAITRSRDCTYAILDDDRGRVTQAFAATIDRITSGTANMPVEVELECVGHRYEVTAVRAPHISYFISYDKKKIWASAHLPAGSGAATSFIVDLRVLATSSVTPPGEGHRVHVTVRAKYGHVPADDKLDWQAVTVNLLEAGSKEVATEILRIKAIEIVDEISQNDETDPEKLHALADKLCQRWTNLKNSSADWGDGTRLISMLGAEMAEMEIRLYNNYLWLEYMLSWKSHQWWQLPLPRMFMEDPSLRLRILAKVDDSADQRAGVPVLLSVMVPEAGLAKAKRYPIDLVAVLDVNHEAGHGNNKEEEEKTRRKMDQLTEAMKLVMDKLSHKDRLAIVPVQASIVAGGHADGFFEMSEQGRSETSAKIKSLVDLVLSKLRTASAKNKVPQTSRSMHQLKKSMEHVRKWLYIPSLNSSIPTWGSAERQSRASMTEQLVEADGSTGVWKALMYAVKILDDREGTEKDRLGFIIVISNSDDNLIPATQEDLKPKYIIHAFSFLNSNTRTIKAMHYLASSSCGIYASLHDHRNQVTEAFTSCIKRITSTIGVQQNVEITCRCSHSSGISLSAIESGEFRPRIGEDGRSVSIKVGNLYAGMAKNFMFYVHNAREDDYGNLSNILNVRVEWQNKFSGMKEVDGQVVVVRNGSEGYKEVMEDIARGEAGKIICKIADSYHDMVAGNLHECLKQASRKAQDAGDAPLAGKMVKMEAILRRKMAKRNFDPSYVETLVADRLSNMLSWLSFQALSEQPPRIPWRSSFRRELLQNYPHKKQE